MTAQARDQIIVKEVQYSMNTAPMNGWLDQRNIRFKMWHTANYRGYTAQWEIRENELWLIEFFGGVNPYNFSTGMPHDPYPGLTVEKLFNGEKEVKANWFSGNLEIVCGNQLHYEHAGHAQIYESEIVIGIEEGNVLWEKHFHYVEFVEHLSQRYSQLARTKKPDWDSFYSFFRQHRNLLHQGLIDEQLNSKN